jgi:hypothetical protein
MKDKSLTELKRNFGLPDEFLAEYADWKKNLTPEEGRAVLQRQGVLHILERQCLANGHDWQPHGAQHYCARCHVLQDRCITG